jgi:serine/threonine-protein kinase RsbT
MENAKKSRLSVLSEVDIAYAALAAKDYAKDLGFTTVSQYMISTAVSELARNIFIYAEGGHIDLSTLLENSKIGIEVIAEDSGPGIDDLNSAMQDHFSTGGTMGVGLPGTKRLMDYFHIVSKLGLGTTITVRKWI